MVVLNDLHFHLLEAFVSRVKAGGGETDSDDILAIDGEFISSLSSDIQEPVGSAIQILRILKDLDKDFNALWKAADSGLSMAQNKLLLVTRHHGILSLPHGILALIFGQVYDDDESCATESIPLVNHYFRDIAIRTPKLWTHLSPHRNPRLFMERNGSLGLEVDILTHTLELSVQRVTPHYRDFLDMVAPESVRWTSLSLPPRDCFDEECLNWTRDVLTGGTLTALRELRIEADYGYYTSLKDLDPFYSDWKMPSLRIIKSRNMHPCVQPASLTCLHLLGAWSDCFDDLDEVARILQAAPLLTELSLEIKCEKVTFHTGTETTLLNVKTLLLVVEAEGGTASTLHDFLACLHTPNLSDLSVDVSISIQPEYKLANWIRAIFPWRNSSWPSLETLDLSMCYRWRSRNYDDEPYRVVPVELFQAIPAVRHLSIRAVDVIPPDSTRWNVQLPHLRTLFFQDCNEFDTELILSIPEIFRAPEFETLKIHNCGKVDAEVIRERMPVGKVLVHTCDWTDDISLL